MTCFARKAITGKAYESLGLKIGNASLEAKQCNDPHRFNTGF